MNITVKNTPLKLAITEFGRTKGMKLAPILKGKAPNEIYEIIGMAHENYDETIEKFTEMRKTIDIYTSPCYRDQIEKEIITQEALDFQPQIQEGINKCGKCGGKKTYQWMSQDRSGDEGMTTYILCIACNNRWKEN